MVGIDLTL